MFYDLIYDKDLITQSIAKQYQVLPSEQEQLPYREWSLLVAGLMDDTPLGRVVQIRMEQDKERIKSFSKYELEVRREWDNFRMSKQTKEQQQNDLKQLEQMLAAMFK